MKQTLVAGELVKLVQFGTLAVRDKYHHAVAAILGQGKR